MTAFILFIFQFIFLIFFQSHWLYGGDSSEYLLSNQTWSIPHPPGYPLYSLLGNLINKVCFFLPEYFRANLLSIIPTLLTAYFLYRTIKLLTKNNFASYTLPCLYLVLFPVWLYASIPEVFALNSFLLILITFLILQYNLTSNKKYRYLIYFLIGLCIAHHHTFILFVPGWYFLLKKNQQSFFRKDILKNLACLFLGFSFYLYVPLASSFNPPIDWENSKTLIGFLRLITRSSYGTFKSYVNSSPNLGNQLLSSLSSIVFTFSHFRLIGLIVLIAGFFHLRKTSKLFFKFVWITLTIELIFLFYTNFPLASFFALATYERFLISLYLILIIVFAFGYLYLEKIIKKINQKYVNNLYLKKIIVFFPRLFLIAYIGIIFISNFTNIRNLATMTDFHYYAQDLLNVPKGAVISVQSDTAYFTVTYLQYLKKYRPDVQFVFLDLLGRDYYRSRLRKSYPDLKIPEPQTDKNLIASFFQLNPQSIILMEKPKDLGIWVPYGLYWQYFPDKTTAEKQVEKLIQINSQLWREYRIPVIARKNNQYLHLQSVQQAYLSMLTAYGEFLYSEKNQQAGQIIERVLSYNKAFSQALNLKQKLAQPIPVDKK